MAQLFRLRLTDGNSTIDFLGSTFVVSDGGFDIGLPRVKRELAPVRPGFYVPVLTAYEYREAKLRFEIRGATRGSVLSSLNSLEQMLRKAHARQRIGAGNRIELQYSWEGATNLTYFEVYGGDVAFPTDVLSVAKVHFLREGQFALPEVELTLYLSAQGYGVSIFSDSLTEVPLYGSYRGTYATGGTYVQNPGGPSYANWVQIDDGSLPGSTPLITKIVLTSHSPYTSWTQLFIGVQPSPFPSKLTLDNSELVDAIGGSTISSSGAFGGSYRQVTYGNTSPWYGAFSDFAWSVQNGSAGIHYAFLHGYNTIPTTLQFSIGIDDYVTYGIQYQGDYVAAATTLYTLPVGVIQVPTTSLDLVNYGTLHPDLWLGLFVAGENSVTLTLDYLSLLPIEGGLRIWKSRINSISSGTFYDDGWKGLEYASNGSYVYTPFYTLAEPVKLEPGVTQRLYFTSMGVTSALADRERAFSVRVYVVPTYQTLAM